MSNNDVSTFELRMDFLVYYVAFRLVFSCIVKFLYHLCKMSGFEIVLKFITLCLEIQYTNTGDFIAIVSPIEYIFSIPGGAVRVDIV